MNKLIIAFLSFTLLFLFIRGMEKKEASLRSEELVELIEYSPWYISLTDSAGLSKAALYAAYNGYLSLKQANKIQNDSVITIVDYSKPSNEERLYVIDIKNQKLLAQSLVAHGQNSGVVLADHFSNKPQSHMSSLGMYITSNTYIGNHGYSLRLEGMEKGRNDKAWERAIVVHGAEYVSKEYIKQNGRIGRSFGCPALPQQINSVIIDLIKGGSSFYIYHPTGIK
jgi:hypothetical protein